MSDTTTDAVGGGASAEAPKTRWFSGFSLRALTLRSTYRRVSKILYVIRAPLVTALLGVIAFAVPGQTREIYWLFAEDFNITTINADANLRLIAFLGLLFVTGYVLWYHARVLTLADADSFDALHRDSGAEAWVCKWAPRIVGAAPSFAAAIGMIGAASAEPLFAPGDGGLLERLSWTVALLYGSAAMAALIGSILLWSSWRRSKRDPNVYDDVRRTAFRTDLRLLSAAAVLGFMAFMMTMPIGFLQGVGALSIMCLFMISLSFGLTVLSYIYDRHAIPLITLLLVGVVLWSWFDWNDNHYARQQEIPTARIAELAGAPEDAAETAKLPGDTDVRQAFRDWLDSRADRQAYIDAGKPYPVYMVAAQGGGLYAAYQSALYLARIHDSCPNFASHIFGLSGVSGGAVGTTVFTSLAMRYALNREPQDIDANPCGAAPLGQENSLESKARDILSQDFLSPVVAAMLFPDFTARFSPVPIPPFDRARALESAFEHAWRRTGDTRVSPLTEGLMTYWRPSGAAPALFVNTTEAGNGRRMILSPIHELGPELRSYAKEAARPGDAAELDYGLFGVPQYRQANNAAPFDMPLSTAMILSARFPYITPAGSLDLMQEIERDQPKQRVKTRLVDGGYFENSGIATAVDVIRQLEEDIENLNVDLRLIVFDLTRDQYREPNHSLGELLSPIQAILSARSSRSALAQSAARRDFTNAFYQSQCRYLLQGGLVPWDDDEACPPSQLKRSRIWSVSLNDFEFDFQLGWILSQETLTRIDRQLGRPDDCRVSTRAIDGDELADGEEDMARESERAAAIAAASQTRYGDGSVLREVAAIELTRDERAVERHNSCVARFITEQLMLR